MTLFDKYVPYIYKILSRYKTISPDVREDLFQDGVNKLIELISEHKYIEGTTSSKRSLYEALRRYIRHKSYEYSYSFHLSAYKMEELTSYNHCPESFNKTRGAKRVTHTKELFSREVYSESEYTACEIPSHYMSHVEEILHNEKKYMETNLYNLLNGIITQKQSTILSKVLEGYTYDEIGRSTGVSRAQVWNQMDAIRKRAFNLIASNKELKYYFQD